MNSLLKAILPEPLISVLKKARNHYRSAQWSVKTQLRERRNLGIEGIRSKISPDSTLVGEENMFFDEDVQILDGAKIICSFMPPYKKTAGSVTIGKRSIVREFVFMITYGGKIEIGDDCTINPFCMIQGNGGLKIGNGVRIATHVSIIPSNHNFSDLSLPIHRQGETAKGITIGDDVWIGTHVTILDGVTIGKGSVIAAGAVVNKDIPDYSIAGGVPARLIGNRKASRIIEKL